MNDNRLYIMKDFTYAVLCKHLHKTLFTLFTTCDNSHNKTTIVTIGWAC